MTETIDFDVELTHTFTARRDRVYAAFVEADQLARWYGPPGFPVPRETVEIDPRVGGVYRLTMVSEADPTVRSGLDGSFTELVPGEPCTWPTRRGGVLNRRMEGSRGRGEASMSGCRS